MEEKHLPASSVISASAALQTEELDGKLATVCFCHSGTMLLTASICQAHDDQQAVDGANLPRLLWPTVRQCFTAHKLMLTCWPVWPCLISSVSAFLHKHALLVDHVPLLVKGPSVEFWLMTSTMAS